ncbi:Myeloid differentiation primary response protein MyD88 [Blomia tropicalis]|nr:Myeloid differentiation primary response protein MyD88 [Blomia tropicalis]
MVRELPLNRRQQFSSYLNSEQILVADSGFARDYRGIAQQLNLTYSEIGKLEKMIDPFGTMLSMQSLAKYNVLELLRMIEVIGRYDLLDDMVPELIEDLIRNNPSTRTDQLLLYNTSSSTEEKIWYDAYVCYADVDLPFVRQLSEKLESEPYNLRLFIRERDLLGGNWIYETFAQLIESQCRRVLTILSPEFLTCPDCAFQAQFATGLAIEKRARLLIPIIYKPCMLPPIIRLLSKIDMSEGRMVGGQPPQWAMDRLIRSIRDESITNTRQIFPALPSNISGSENNRPTPPTPPIIELCSEQFPTVPNSPMDTIITTISNDSDEHGILIPVNNSHSTAKNSSNTLDSSKGDWFSKIKRKIKNGKTAIFNN